MQAPTPTKTPRKRCQNGHREVEGGNSGTTGQPLQILKKGKCEALTKQRMLPTLAEISEHIHYDPTSGSLTWKTPGYGRAKTRVGKQADNLNNKGYLRVKIFGGHIYSHRLAWLLHYGEWPSLHLDHMNGDRADNRISNLRTVSILQNNWNRHVDPPNITGFRGVTAPDPRCTKKTFRAYVYVEGRKIHLGGFATAEEAYSAHLNAVEFYRRKIIQD